MERRLFLAMAAVGFAATAGAAAADPIAAGQTLSGLTVAGQASVYDIFGHPGDPGGDYGPDLPAVQVTFSAAGGNVFTFSATGAVSCCGDAPTIPPDGAGGGMNVVGANGLSGLSGNEHVPLVGVFTSDTDPFGGAAPPALSFDVNNPASLSPLLDQVFYIGDGRAGYLDPLGATLTFTAPTNATRLYLGAIDAFGFGGVTGYYNDNKGAFSVDVTLSNDANGVPEPAAWGLMILGFGAAGAMARRRRALGPAA